MRKTMMGWVVATFAVATVLAVPSDVRSQSSLGIQKAAELEAEASQLHDQPDRWAYAAGLYLAAVQLRQEKDPQAQEDLLMVANLSFETGNAVGAIAALESAGSRALASGDVARAAEILTDAVWVAKKAGLKSDQSRLSFRVAELARSSELTGAETRQILSRFQGA